MLLWKLLVTTKDAAATVALWIVHHFPSVSMYIVGFECQCEGQSKGPLSSIKNILSFACNHEFLEQPVRLHTCCIYVCGLPSRWTQNSQFQSCDTLTFKVHASDLRKGCTNKTQTSGFGWLKYLCLLSNNDPMHCLKQDKMARESASKQILAIQLPSTLSSSIDHTAE